MYCPKCGARVDNTEEFCYKCGQKITENKSEDNTANGKNKNKKHGGMASIAAVIIIVVAIVVMTVINGVINGTGNIDYNNYGFENMDETETWMMIKEPEQLSSDEPYVYGKSTTLQFNNGFLKQVNYWNDVYDENDGNATGEIYDTVNYGIVDNSTINFISGYYNGSTFYIISRDLSLGIPILECDFNSTSHHKVYDYGYYIPTKFIDWSKSPEEVTYINEYGREVTDEKYYIDAKYLR